LSDNETRFPGLLYIRVYTGNCATVIYLSNKLESVNN